MDGRWAITHDFMFELGGAERVTALIAHRVLPGARVVAFGGNAEIANELEIDVEFLSSKYTFANFRALSMQELLPFRRRRVSADCLLHSSYAFAHHIRPKNRPATEVVYCHSPVRQLWSGREMYTEHLSPFLRAPVTKFMGVAAAVDRRRAGEMDQYIATGSTVADRIRRHYGRTADAVIPPPIDKRFFDHPLSEKVPKRHIVWMGRVVEPYKKLTLLIEAMRYTDARLTVIGDGRDLNGVRGIAPANVEFLGRMETEALIPIVADADALVFPGADDFGMTVVEAMALGTPVLAYAQGGARDTVIEGINGAFFWIQEPQSLASEIDRVLGMTWVPESVRASVFGFHEDEFVRLLRRQLLDEG